MKKTTVRIDGMMCGMCEAHICDVIRKTFSDAKKVSASRGKSEGISLEVLCSPFLAWLHPLVPT